MNSQVKELQDSFRSNVEAEIQLAALGGPDYIDMQIATYVGAIKVLKHKRNMLSSISRLPEEILACIFLCLLRDCSFYLKWLTVTHTCKSWRRTALDTPELWSYINANLKSDIVQVFLERSKAADLTIRMGGQTFYDGRVHSNYLLILEHWSRIKDLNINLPNLADKDWQNMFSAITCTSRLRRLRLNKVASKALARLQGSPCVDCSNLIQSTASLASLRLSGFSFSWSSFKLENLSELILESLGAETKGPTIVDILNMLAQSPNLTSLTLDEYGPLDSPTDSLFYVSLPNLRAFTIIRADTNICIKLLQTLGLPGDIEWYIECHNYPIWEPKTIYTYLPSPSAVYDILNIILSFSYIQIQTFIHGSSDLKTCLHLTWDKLVLNPNSLPRIVNVLSVQISQHVWKDLSRLEFHIENPDIITSREQWVELLHRFEGLHHLTCCLRYGYQDLTAETEFCLAKSLMHTVAPGMMICPNLTHVEFISVNFFEGQSDIKTVLVECLILREENNSPLGTLTIQDAFGMTIEDAENFKRYVKKLDWDEVNSEIIIGL